MRTGFDMIEYALSCLNDLEKAGYICGSIEESAGRRALPSKKIF
jgi:DNA-binding PadR family transcriptional regulator